MASRLLVVGLLAVVVLMVAAAYVRRRRADSNRDAAGLPRVPQAFVGDSSRTWLVFTTTYCTSCSAVEAELRRAHPTDRVRRVDVGDEPRLADDFSIRRAPTVLEVDASGVVLARLVGPEAVRSRLAAV